MAFHGINGVGDPGKHALLSRTPPKDNGDPLLINTDVGAGVRMDKVRQLDSPCQHAHAQHQSHTVTLDRDDQSRRSGKRGRENKPELIRAWEEELVKIEKASRRSSNMLAFWRRKDKPKESLKERIAT